MQQAIREKNRLSRLPGVLAWTAARILPWIRSHPEEPLAPEALHLLVRSQHPMGTKDPLLVPVMESNPNIAQIFQNIAQENRHEGQERRDMFIDFFGHA